MCVEENGAQEKGAEKWFVMRDLKRSNALKRAYGELEERGFEVFTPKETVITTHRGRRERVERPAIADLLFVRAAKEALDPVVAAIATLQYRYVKGAPYQTPMTVGDKQMDTFIDITRSASDVKYYAPEEIKPEMYGKRIKIIGGSLDGLSGNLLSVRGARKKRLLVNLENIIAASAVVEADYIVVDEG